jgi:transformation/transcription domain-associated protein
LEIIHRFPYNDSLKVFAVELMKVLLNVLVQDNEENAVVSLKIIVDLHKNYTVLMKDYVQQFMEIVKEMYKNMPVAVTSQFGDQV